MLDIVILILAVWRVSSLLANEDGPWMIFERFRLWVGVIYNQKSIRIPRNEFAKNILCMWCNSVGLGVLATVCYLLFPEVTIWVALPFALSTGAILIAMSRGLQIHYRSRGE